MVHAEASGPHSVAVGRDVEGGVNIANVYLSAPGEPVSAAIVASDPVYRKVEIERFVGREWMTQALDAFLDQEPSGYFVIEGNAGTGKTSYLAWLSSTRGYFSHFAGESGNNTLSRAVRNLSAQLIQRFDLTEVLTDGRLPHDAGEPVFLERVLERAARGSRTGRRPIVLLLDAVDDIEGDSGRAGLPGSLPDGVFFVVSHRPVYVGLYPPTPQGMLLDPADPNNVRDVRTFLDSALREPEIEQGLAAAGITRDDMIDVLLERSEGLWIYVSFVLREMRKHSYVPDPESLPRGLWQFFAQYWQSWANDNRQYWDGDRRLLATFATAEQPVSAHALALFSGLEDRVERVRAVLAEWRPFLHVSGRGPGRTFGIYHASLKDFLSGASADMRLTAGQEAFQDDLTSAVEEAHSRIAGSLLDAWGGLDNGLPGLGRSDLEPDVAQYGRHHLLAHLLASGETGTVMRVLTLDGQAPSESSTPNAWFAAHVDAGDIMGYLGDLDRVWSRVAEDRTQESLGRQIRLALMKSSVKAVGLAYSGTALRTLVERGVLTAPQALSYSALKTYGAASATAEIFNLLPRDLQLGALADLETKKPYDRAHFLHRVARDAPEELLGDVLSKTLELGDFHRSGPLIEIIPRLQERHLRLVADSLAAMPPSFASFGVAVALGERVDDSLADAVLGPLEDAQESLLWARAAFVSRATGEAARTVARETLQAALDRPTVVRQGVAYVLATLVERDLLRSALLGTGEADGSELVTTLRTVASSLDEARAQVVFDLLSGVEQVNQRSLLQILASQLPKPSLIKMFDVSFESLDGPAEAVTTIVPHLPDGYLQSRLRELMGSPAVWLRWVTGLTYCLPPPVARDVWESAAGLSDERAATIGRAAAAPRLPAEERRAALDEMREAAQRLGADDELRVLIHLLPFFDQLEEPAERIRSLAQACDRELAEEATRRLEIYTSSSLDPTRMIQSWERVDEVVALIDRAEESSGPEQDALFEEVIAFPGRSPSDSVIEAIVRRLPQRWLRKMLASFEVNDDGFARWSALVELLVQDGGRAVPIETYLDTFNSVASTFRHDHRREAVEKLVEVLPQDVLRGAFESLSKVEDTFDRRRLQGAFAPRLMEPPLRSVLEGLLDDVAPDAAPWERARLFETLLGRLPAEGVALVLDRLDIFSTEAEFLEELAPRLDSATLQALVGESLRTAPDARVLSWPRLGLACALFAGGTTALALELPGNPWVAAASGMTLTWCALGAFAGAVSFSGPWTRAEVLAAIGPSLPTDLRSQVVERLPSRPRLPRMQVLAAFARTASQTELELICARISASDLEWLRKQDLPLLEGLAGCLPEAVVAETLERVASAEELMRDARHLEALLPALSGSLLTRALDVIREFAPYDLLEAMRHVVKLPLSAETVAELVEEALASDHWTRFSVVELFARTMSDDDVSRVLSAMEPTEHSFERASFLAAASPRLTEAVMQGVVDEAGSVDLWVWARSLSAIAPCLPKSLVEEAFATVLASEREVGVETALTALAPRLDWDRVERALAETAEAPNRSRNPVLLAALAECAPTAGERRAMLERAIAKFAEDDDLTRPLTELLPAFRPLLDESRAAWYPYLRALSASSRSDALKGVEEGASSLARVAPAAIPEAVVAIEDVARWWP